MTNPQKVVSSSGAVVSFGTSTGTSSGPDQTGSSDTTNTVSTGAHDFSIGVGQQGNAAGIKKQFGDSDPRKLQDSIDATARTVKFANETMGRLHDIEAALADAWQGANADHARHVIYLVREDARLLAENTTKVHDSLAAFEAAWTDLRNKSFNIGDDDDLAAQDLFTQICAAMDTCMHGMPDVMTYYEPLKVKYDNSTTSGGLGGGIGNGGGIKPPDFSGPGGFGGGTTPTFGGLDSGAFDPSSNVAGLGGDPGGIGDGAGLGAGGVGAGGVGAGRLGGGAGLGGGGGSGAAGAGGVGGFAPPMTGAGAGGNQEDEHERNTWLEEDEDVWGAGDAPSSVIS